MTITYKKVSLNRVRPSVSLALRYSLCVFYITTKMYHRIQSITYSILKVTGGLSILLLFWAIDLLACTGTIIPQKLTPWHNVPNMDGAGGMGAFTFNIPSDSVIVFNKPNIINLSHTPKVNGDIEKDKGQSTSERYKYVQTMCKIFPVSFQSQI